MRAPVNPSLRDPLRDPPGDPLDNPLDNPLGHRVRFGVRFSFRRAFARAFRLACRAPCRAAAALPSLTTVAVLVLCVASAIQFLGRLPDAALLVPIALAVPFCGIGAVLAGRSGHPARSRRFAAASGCAALAVAAALGLTARIETGLQSRLPATLEGIDLDIVAVVDEMAQRRDFGDSLRFTVEQCRRAVEDAAGSEDRAAGCGTLRRVQLGWSLPRLRDRMPDLAAGDADPADEPDDAARPALGPGWPTPGERWRLTVRLRRPVAPVNPDAFDLELRLLQQGIGAVGRVYRRQRLPPAAGLTPAALAARAARAIEAHRTLLRDRLEAAHAFRVDAPSAGRSDRWPLIGIVTGLSLGDQGAISPAMWALFSRTGVSHLMAISGMHVTMLALVAAAVSGWLWRQLTHAAPAALLPLVARLPRQILVLLVAVVCAFGYALLSG